MKTLAFTVILFSAVVGISVPSILEVPAHYPTIQQAITHAATGDTVLVAPGTYVENINFHGKAITVKSSDGAECTVIDGGVPSHPDYGSVVCFMSDEGADSVLEGFTVTNGFGTLDYSGYCGGGIYCDYDSSPTLINNTIIGNSVSGSGSGIFCSSDSEPTIVHNTITGNSAGMSGGGICCDSYSRPTIVNNTITGNSTDWSGGGIAFFMSFPAPCTNNTITENSAGTEGGGIHCSWSDITFTKNTIKENSAENNGGGISTNYSCLTLINNMITGNSAGLDGGGIYYYRAIQVLVNNTIAENSAGRNGGGLNIYRSNTTLTNNTIYGNSSQGHGGGIYSHSSVYLTIVNSILWANAAQAGSEIWVRGSTMDHCTLSISYSDLEGGQASVHVDLYATLNWLVGMIDENPLVADPLDADFHLTWQSPCKDTGDNAAITESYDLEGDPRIAYGTVDMGADEFYTHFYCTGDFTPGGSVKGKLVGMPGTIPTGIIFGSDVLETPLSCKWGSIFLAAPWFVVPLDMAIDADGITVIPEEIPLTPAAPYDIFMQALIGLDPDSLTNLFVMKVR